MSIMDLFAPKPANNDGKQNQNQNQNQNVDSKGNNNNNQNQNNDGNNNNNNNKQNKDTNTPENPFDTYQKLFDNANSKSDIKAPSFSIDPKVIADVKSKLDFTQGINPELIQKAKSGDAEALIGLVQEVGRNAYHASLEHTTRLTDTHLGQRSEFEQKRLQSGIKDQLTSDALASTSANFNHPVIKAELNRIARQFAASDEYADATPQQIADAAKKYINDLYSAMNPEANKKLEPKDAEVDYVKYLSGEN